MRRAVAAITVCSLGALVCFSAPFFAVQIIDIWIQNLIQKLVSNEIFRQKLFVFSPLIIFSVAKANVQNP
jgi:hypothetical protein